MTTRKSTTRRTSRSTTTRRATTARRAPRRRTSVTSTVGSALGMLVVTALLNMTWKARIGLVLLVLVIGAAYILWSHRAELAATTQDAAAGPQDGSSGPQDAPADPGTTPAPPAAPTA